MRGAKAGTVVLCAAVSAGAWVDKDVAAVLARRSYWAFQKPVRTDPPRITNPWIRTPIDAFLLDALKQKKLTPSKPLDREHLLRRVTFDLTGLPPTPGEIDLFLRDTRPDAYERLVDRLLASPHYGERWALHWLDVVRYADTNGYEADRRAAQRLALSRLCCARVQQQQAVRPFRARTDRRRRAVPG